MQNSTSINETIQAAANGSQLAQTKLYNEFLPLVKSTCKAILKYKSTDEVEDCILIAMNKVLRNIAAFDGSKSCINTWVSNIAKNTCIDSLRKDKTNTVSIFDGETGNTIADHLTDGAENGEQTLISSEQIQAANAKIASLSPKYKEIIELRLKGMSYIELSETLNIPIGTVKARLFRAAEQFK